MFIFGQIQSDTRTAAAAVSVVLLAIALVVLLAIRRRLTRWSAAPWPLGGRLGKYGLRCVALGYLFALLLIPVVLIFYRAFEHGLAARLGGGDHAGGACTPSS